MTESLEEFLSDGFHSCALYAFAYVAAESQKMPPDSDTVKRMAYSVFEETKTTGGRERHPPVGAEFPPNGSKAET